MTQMGLKYYRSVTFHNDIASPSSPSHTKKRSGRIKKSRKKCLTIAR